MVAWGNPVRRDWVGANRDKIQRYVYENYTSCIHCPRPIAWKADPRSKWAPSVEHLIPRSLGGDPFDPANCRLAHLGCNAARGKRLMRPSKSVTSRAW